MQTYSHAGVDQVLCLARGVRQGSLHQEHFSIMRYREDLSQLHRLQKRPISINLSAPSSCARERGYIAASQISKVSPHHMLHRSFTDCTTPLDGPLESCGSKKIAEKELAQAL